MHRILFFLIASLYINTLNAQHSFRIVNKNNAEIPFAVVKTDDNQTVLLSNNEGFIQIPNTVQTIQISALGYSSKKYQIQKTNSEIVLDSLIYSNDSTINKNHLVKNAIHNRIENDKRSKNIKFNFYGKGSLDVTNYPEKFLGYDIDQLDPNLKLDSLKQGNIFSSETLSTVYQNAPNKHKEIVEKNYLMGNSRNQNFLTALESDINFYKNIAYKDWGLISPLASNAINYYDYSYGGFFIDVISKQKIHILHVNPLRSVDPAMKGTIYLVDETFEIYAIDAFVKGKNVGQGQVTEYHIQQLFSFNSKINKWIKTLQTIDFQGKILVFSFNGSFINLQSRYEEFPEKKDFFSKEVITYDHVNDSLDYFKKKRPIFLTDDQEEIITEKNDEIIEKDTKVYQDSLDRNHNRFNLFKLVLGYKNRDSKRNVTYKYNGLLSTFAFNPVQGFNVTTGLSYLKEKPNNETFYEIGGLVNYGTAENKPRFSGYYTQLFNRVTKSKLTLAGGLTVNQFGEDFPIKKLINSIAASYFGRNYAKYYQKDFISAQYEQDLLNGLFSSFELEYANRRPLFNNTINSPFVKKRIFSSNNPIDPQDFTNPGFEQNQIVKLKIKAVINFDQKYIKYPHKKTDISYSRYPLVHFNFETGFASSVPKYNYALIGLSTLYQNHLKQYGNFGVYINAGKFLNAEGIAFMDYKHFYGNETFVGTTKNYLKNFNLLPYYDFSTNKDFLELHAEHNFKGFFTNKVPFFNKLQWHLVVGAHALFTYENKSYYETSIGLDNVGFGNFRPFRIDYFQSFNGSKQTNGIIIGVKLLDKMK